MRDRKNLILAALALLLVLCAAGYYFTGEAPAPRPSGKQAAQLPSLIDDKPLKTARQLAALAETPEEQDQAREALRLADHELDQAFATALREAAPTGAPDASTTAPQRELAARIAQLKTKVAGEQALLAELAKQATPDTDPENLGFVKAQLELDQDDLEDAQQDLARLGSDRHGLLERALQEHEAAQQGSAPLPKPIAPAAPATLKDQVQRWLTLNDKHSALLAAQHQAAAKASNLERQHNGLDSLSPAGTAAGPSNAEEEDTAAVVARLRKLSDQKKTLAELDKRIQDCRQLAAAYQTWTTLVETRQRAIAHVILRSLGTILAILLALLLAYRLALYIARASDRRRRNQVQVATAISCQFLAVVAIVLIIFGPPTQISTMLGLATAGLTVVLKDFIVGFIGWFVLMGRNGVRIGDWVEINGVGGEVIEIGVFKTVLLEMGNWTNTGHPTGRRVSFSNSYAIEGHYFNFSTVGQWLWDELQVTLPSTGEPYQVAEQIRLAVEHETEEASAEAARDWERVTHQYGVTKFSAKPAVDLRPNVSGITVVVRYITRAPLRYEVKSRLFQAIVALLHTSAVATEPHA